MPFPILFGTTVTTVLHYRADCDDSQTRVLSKIQACFGGSPPKKLSTFPKNFGHVGNYNLDVEAPKTKSNANYSTGICYLLSEVLIFVDKCIKSPNSSNLHGFNKLHVSNKKPDYKHVFFIHAMQSITVS